MSGYFGGLGSSVGSPLFDFGDTVIYLFKDGWGLAGGDIDACVLPTFLYTVAFMDTTTADPPTATSDSVSACAPSGVTHADTERSQAGSLPPAHDHG